MSKRCIKQGMAMLLLFFLPLMSSLPAQGAETSRPAFAYKISLDSTFKLLFNNPDGYSAVSNEGLLVLADYAPHEHNVRTLSQVERNVIQRDDSIKVNQSLTEVAGFPAIAYTSQTSATEQFSYVAVVFIQVDSYKLLRICVASDRGHRALTDKTLRNICEHLEPLEPNH